MTKKARTVLLMIAATLFNIVLMIVFFILFSLILFGLLPSVFPSMLESQAMGFVLPVLWIGGTIGCTFFIYSRMIRWASAKFDLESKLDPIFQPKKARPRKEREE